MQYYSTIKRDKFDSHNNMNEAKIHFAKWKCKPKSYLLFVLFTRHSVKGKVLVWKIDQCLEEFRVGEQLSLKM